MEKVFIFMTSLIVLSTANLKSQVTIGSLTTPKATLDVVKTNGATADGIIAPRLTLAELNSANANNIYTVDQKGAIVYITDLTGGTSVQTVAVVAPGYYYFDGVNWQPFSGANTANSWLTTGNTGTAPNINFIGTTDNQPLMFRVNNMSAGKIDILYGTGSTSFGLLTLASNTTGYNNSAFGEGTLWINTSGYSNSAFGTDVLYNNNTGAENSAFGESVLYNNNTGSDNSAFGSYALTQNTTGSFNNAFGAATLQYNTNGSENNAFGHYALQYNNGDYNSAFGNAALSMNTGSNNSAFGYAALQSNTSGSNNNAFGYAALGYSVVTGSNNLAIGNYAGSNLSSGNYNILIGDNAEPSAGNVSGEITIGSSNTNAARVYADSWSYLSDRRMKHDIRSINQGLDFVMKLKPVEFVYNSREEQTKSLGFIAQDIQEVMHEEDMAGYDLVTQMDENTLGLSTEELIPLLTKAIQEQQKIIEQLETRLKVLETK